MRALASSLAFLALFATVLAGSSASANPPPPPCAHPFVPAGVQEVAVPTAGRFQTNLTVPSAGSYAIGFKGAFPSMPVGGGMGRNLVAAFLENATGDFVWGAVVLSHPFGVHAVAGSTHVDVQSFVGFCTFFHIYESPVLDAGTHRLVVLTASETETAYSVFLPTAATQGATSTGPAIAVSEATLACGHRLHAQAYTAWTTNLVGCTQAFSIPNRAYGFLTLGRDPDATHEVHLTGPGGNPSYHPVPSFAGVEGGPAGTWTVDVPLYLSPLSLNGVPSHDTGIYGVFADVA